MPILDTLCCPLQSTEYSLVVLCSLFMVHRLKLHQLLRCPEVANQELAGKKVPGKRGGGVEENSGMRAGWMGTGMCKEKQQKQDKREESRLDKGARVHP